MTGKGLMNVTLAVGLLPAPAAWCTAASNFLSVQSLYFGQRQYGYLIDESNPSTAFCKEKAHLGGYIRIITSLDSRCQLRLGFKPSQLKILTNLRLYIFALALYL